MTNEQLAEIETRLNAASPGHLGDGFASPIAAYAVYERWKRDFDTHAPADITALIAEVRRLTEFAAKFSLAWEKLCDFEMDNPPPPKEAGIDEYRCWRKELNAHKNVIHDLIEPPKTRVALNIDALIAEVRRLQAESEAVRDALIDMVGQHCHLRPGQIHDSGLSSDEHACGVLERIGVIRAVDESQHRYEWVEVAADKTP